MKRLLVLYKAGCRFVSTEAAVLSFMPPSDEAVAAKLYPDIFFGRKESDAVRVRARKAYKDLVCRISSTPCNGKTLRQALSLPDKGNPWWYHAVSEKQSENDDAYDKILQIFTILDIAGRVGADEIVVYGSSKEIVETLNSRYRTSGVSSFSDWKSSLLRAIPARGKYLFAALMTHGRVQSFMPLSPVMPEIKPDVVFHGFWGLNIKMGGDSKLRDVYFKSLPDKLAGKGIVNAWFAWIDKPAIKRSVIRTAAGNNVVFVQKFLNIGDIFSNLFDIRPLVKYCVYSRSAAFAPLFKEEGCDLGPVLRRKMLSGFCDASIPHNFLMETAYKRAFTFYKPKAAFSFLGLFLSARAFNSGASIGSSTTLRFDMQHAGLARDKTSILTDRQREAVGEPDGNAMPQPEYFFVMGELAKEILVEEGVPSEKVFVTGSARYDHLNDSAIAHLDRREVGPLKVLIVSTLNVKLDFEMVEAASAACEKLPVELRLRSHPLAKIEALQGFRRYEDKIISSKGSLEEDLADADIVLFTYSTVADEAFLKGVPVVRWQTAGFNGSVFKDIDHVPMAYSVGSLRDIVKRFIANPQHFKPEEKVREMVLKKCFYSLDGMAASRIADKVEVMIAH